MISFDLQEKYVAVASKTSVEIFPLQKNCNEQHSYKLDEDKFSLILDMVLDSSKGEPYKCHIAAKSSQTTSV